MVRDREVVRDREGREGVRDKEYGVVQGVWFRAGLGVGRDWGTGGLGVWGGGRVGRDWGWVGVRMSWRTGWGWYGRVGRDWGVYGCFGGNG